jgi:hypothetical protein
VEVACYACHGSGKTHYDCASCHCACGFCSGTGKIVGIDYKLVEIEVAFYSPKYISWLQSLPGLELDRIPPGVKPLRFRFDGGEGLLMPCRR